MKYWLMPVYAVVGFLAIVLILPSSRWVVLTQLDVVAGRWKYLGGPSNGMFPNMTYVYPTERGLDENDSASDEMARFLRLVAPGRSPNNDAEYDQRIRDLFDICRAKNDARYWAQFVRVTANFSSVVRTVPGQKPPSLHDNPAVQVELRDACIEGKRLDPGNAYFPVLLAGVLNRLGQLRESREAYLEAGHCNRYDDYLLFEPDSRYSFLVSHFGDRGHQLKAVVYAEILLQHLAPVYTLAMYFSQPEDLQGRLATLKISALIMGQSKSVISVIVGRKMAAISLGPPSMKSTEALAQKDSTLRAEQLASALHGDNGIGNAMRVYNSIHIDESSWPPSPDATGLIINLRPALSAWSFLALFLLPIVLGFTWRKADSPRFSAASPYLVWLIVSVTKPMLGADIGEAQIFFATSLLFIPALFPKLRNFVDVLGILIAAIALFVSLRFHPLGIPAVLFLVSLIVERRLKSVPTAVTAVAVIAGCVLTSGLWISEATQLGFGSGLIFGLLATIGVCAAIPVRMPVRWAPIAGSACVALGLLYGVMVARDLSADTQVAVLSEKLLRDADDVRKR